MFCATVLAVQRIWATASLRGVGWMIRLLSRGDSSNCWLLSRPMVRYVSWINWLRVIMVVVRCLLHRLLPAIMAATRCLLHHRLLRVIMAAIRCLLHRLLILPMRGITRIICLRMDGPLSDNKTDSPALFVVQANLFFVESQIYCEIIFFSSSAPRAPLARHTILPFL